MIALGSFVGFALLFLGSSVCLSLVSGLALLGCRRRLADGGPALERAAAGWALVLPPLLAALVTAAVLGQSLLGRALGIPDHCPSDGFHPHLCAYHGAEWASHTWPVVLVAVIGSLALYRAVARLWRLALAGRLVETLQAAADGRPEMDVHIVRSDKAFCFSAGFFRSRIFVSTAVWQRLDESERKAVLAHERAHVREGDVWRRAVLGLLSLIGAPGLTRLALRAWEHATERLRDRDAAVAVGDPAVVAGALVALAGGRAARGRLAPGSVAFLSGAGKSGAAEVVARVEALLAGGPDGQDAARRFGRWTALALAGALVTTVLVADPLHHGSETLLGVL
jgi:Zn-dependent protease with chaperone function